MVSVNHAKELIKNAIPVLNSEMVGLEVANGRVIAEDVFSQINIPGFNQSAMDGYAVHSGNDVSEGDTFELIGEIKAGDSSNLYLEKGKACRIFTGAMVPEGADTIVIQEIVSVKDGTLIVEKNVRFGANIREEGEQISNGDTAFQKGTVLNPAGIGFLSMLGLNEIKVFRSPKITLLVTGNELVAPGNKLKKGQIYESNSITIASALQGFGFTDIDIKFIKDDLGSTIMGVKDALENSDFIIASGGISVGDYDFVGKAFAENGVKEIFYKVRQKPGKPLFFGKANDCFVFGLPGNPASALTSVYQYVIPAVNTALGKGFSGLEETFRVLNSEFVKKGDRAIFLKGFCTNEEVELMDGQSSAMMHTYAVSNCLVFVDENQMNLEKGHQVKVYLLP